MLPMPVWSLWGCVQFAWSFVGLLLPCMPRMSWPRGAAGTERGTWPDWANGAAGNLAQPGRQVRRGAWPGWYHWRSRARGAEAPQGLLDPRGQWDCQAPLVPED